MFFQRDLFDFFATIFWNNRHKYREKRIDANWTIGYLKYGDEVEYKERIVKVNNGSDNRSIYYHK